MYCTSHQPGVTKKSKTSSLKPGTGHMHLGINSRASRSGVTCTVCTESKPPSRPRWSHHLTAPNLFHYTWWSRWRFCTLCQGKFKWIIAHRCCRIALFRVANGDLWEWHWRRPWKTGLRDVFLWSTGFCLNKWFGNAGVLLPGKRDGRESTAIMRRGGNGGYGGISWFGSMWRRLCAWFILHCV